MTLLSKVWGWIKKSWKLLVGLLVGIVVTALTLGRGSNGFKVLKVLRKSEEELDEKIDDELAAQAEREKRIDEETQKRLAEIEEKFSRRVERGTHAEEKLEGERGGGEKREREEEDRREERGERRREGGEEKGEREEERARERERERTRQGPLWECCFGQIAIWNQQCKHFENTFWEP